MSEPTTDHAVMLTAYLCEYIGLTRHALPTKAEADAAFRHAGELGAMASAVRLHAGDGELSAPTVLDACDAEIRRRGRG